MFGRPVRELILLLLLAGFRGSAGQFPAQGFLQAIDFYLSGRRFGGFSALHLTADGCYFVALSDEGFFVRGNFVRDASDRIASFTTGPVTRFFWGRAAMPCHITKPTVKGWPLLLMAGFHLI